MHIDLNIQVAPDQRLFPTHSEIQSWTETALEGQSNVDELTIRFVGHEEMYGLNEQYRGQAKSTNVLAFPNPLTFESQKGYLGDIVICIPVVEHEAKKQDKDLKAHYAHLIIHGTLHLLGYDHQQAEEATLMEELEIKILKKLGFPDPYGGFLATHE